jgi:ribosome-associated protein
MKMEKISRSQKKRNAQALQKLGEQLIFLSDAQFEALKLPEDLMEAVAMARGIKQREAHRRQLQYIGRLMRSIDPAVIQAAMEKACAGEVESKRRFKLVERWRDELVAGDVERFGWLVDNFSSIDSDELSQLISNAQGKQPQVNPKKAGKSLFRYLVRLT